MSPKPTIKSEQYEVLDRQAVAAQLERLSRLRPTLSGVLQGAAEEGFTALEGEDSHFGWRVKFEAASEISAPLDATPGPGVSSLTVETLIQGYKKGEDQAAAVTLTATAGQHTHDESI